MRRFMLLAALLCLFSFPAAAQKVEIFGGAQYTHLNPSFNGAGWNVAVTGNFKHLLGITADFGGAYGIRTHTNTYTAGPTISFRLPIVQPYVHALFGGMTLADGASNTAFAMMFGGGFDVGLRKGIGLRIVQVDWISTHFNSNTQNGNFRVAAGLVLKF